jgi:hypothetical protein
MMSTSPQSHQENLTRATAAAIAAVRQLVIDDGIPEFLRRRAKGSTGASISPLKRMTELDDIELGIIVTAVIFAWVRARTEQALAESRDPEEMVKIIGADHEPADIAVITSILPALADTAQIDWALPLERWSKETMIGFLATAWGLLSRTELIRDHTPEGRILQKSSLNGDGGGASAPPFQ